MTDRPIIFSAPMVQALLDGRKTQTRRIIKIKDHLADHTFTGDLVDYYGNGRLGMVVDGSTLVQPIPYTPGDRLWAREAHAFVPASAYRNSLFVEQKAEPGDLDRAAIFRAGFDHSQGGIRWRPSIHMPRWASRLTLTVTDVRVQRLQEISRGDAMDEGCPHTNMADGPNPRDWFAELWNIIHGPDAWDGNPWVVALTFDVHRCNIDQMKGNA